jgi:phage terminase large subunit-like protein
MRLYEKFIKDVKSNPDEYCELVHYSVNRHLSDLKESKKKKYKYYFNAEEADRVIQISKNLRHTKGSFKGRLFDLQPYQAFILANIFGWLFKETNLRRFQKAYIETARKSGKSEFAAVIEIIMAYFDGEPGADVYTVATKRDQAEYVYGAAKVMLNQLSKDSKSMSKRIKIQQYVIKDLQTGSTISKLTADGDKEDGANPHCGVVDEFHAHVNDGIYKVVETGIVSRDNPLILIITTAGFNKEGPCYHFRQTVAIPTIKNTLRNDRVFAMIFTLDEKDITGTYVGTDDDGNEKIYPNWYNEKVWKKANPNIGNTPRLQPFRGLAKTALLEGASARVQFLTKNLNVWTDSPDVWIKSEDWEACGNPKLNIHDFKGKEVYLGLDLSTLHDISALDVLFPPQKGIEKFTCFSYFFCPPSKINGYKRTDKVDYRQWQEDGDIIATSSAKKTIDYDAILKKIEWLCKVLDVRCVGYDPFNYDKIIPSLEERGVECMAYKQVTTWMHTPTKKLEELTINKMMVHDANPVMNWMIGNVVIMRDTNDNMKIDKKKSINKVDGPVARAISIGTYLTKVGEDQLITVDNLGILTEEDMEEDNYDDEEVITVDDLAW